MSNKPSAPAIEGWFTLDEQPHLIGTRCNACGTYYFPKQDQFCRNPGCDSTEFSEVKLSRTGTLWSYTNACYKPPAPFVAAEPFEPYAIAAVQLEAEQMVVLGQVVEGTGVEALKVGMPMELVLEPLHETDDDVKITWKWQPMSATASEEG
ncbi:Zn-ribbon domain-containing OB-fold protein [Halioglobus pacificus]|uniref:Benzoylsuccinyl-CoA thiolase n=1 Tax=Parahalioglobus pacificus TaxID=930806 RepID=A0A919CK97_9GAMM|nr:Zn-ribbon domain-containing OB-fold protein [Halioglobus pacificus]NQY04019.1 Zn-ribbon domain-containing OB-fold protein [Halieaceae bacterium]GHD32544.1 hypothetical protein GCM10007053_16980 [Halioglobus pacificus]